MTTEEPPAGSSLRRGAPAAVAVVLIACWVLSARELAGWIVFCRPDGAAAAARLLPLDPSVLAADAEQGPAKALAHRPRDPSLLQEVIEERFVLDEPEARRLMVVAAHVAPYGGIQAGYNAERLLALATDRARATVEARELVRRMERSKSPVSGLEDARLEAEVRAALARDTIATILAIDAEIAERSRGRRTLDAAVEEAKRLLDDLRDGA